MAGNALQEGISILYDMELNNYLMARSINQLNQQISQLGYKRKFYKPVKKENRFSITEYFWVMLGVGGIAGAVIGVIYGLCIGDGFFYKIGEAIAGAINFGLALGCLGGIIGFIMGIIRRSKTEKELEKQYLEDCKTHEQNISRDLHRVKGELEQQKILIQQRNSLLARKRDADAKLNNFYAAMGIDDKFCHLIPIGYMHEFMRLGIADKLEGADGLYYLVMQELRHDQLQCTLEDILDKLDVIVDNQHSVYHELMQINNKCDNMVRMTMRAAETAVKNNQLLETAVANTSIAAYNSERISKELAFQNFMLTYC